MNPATQTMIVLSAPVAGYFIWWMFRWSRKRVGIASALLTVWKMRRRLRRCGRVLDDETVARLMDDTERISRTIDELSE